MRLWVRAHDVVRASSSRFSAKKVVNSLWFRKNIESLLIINYLSPKMDHVQQRGQTKTTLLALPEVKQKQKQKQKNLPLQKLSRTIKKEFRNIKRKRKSKSSMHLKPEDHRGSWCFKLRKAGKIWQGKNTIQNKLEGRRNKEKKRYVTQMWCGGETKSIFSQQRGFTMIHLNFHTFKHSQQLGRTKRTC